MGGASASAVPAASLAGGYAGKGAMSAATVGGTTGSNVSGMGWVPKAQVTGAGTNYSEIAKLFGGALKDASGQFGSAVAGQQYGLGGQSSGFGGSATASPYAPPAPFPFSGLNSQMPPIRSGGFRLASAAGGPLRQTGMGYTI